LTDFDEIWHNDATQPSWRLPHKEKESAAKHNSTIHT